MAVTIVKIKALSKRIDNKEWIEIQFLCTEHGGLGTVFLTDRQWSEMANNLVASQICARCARENYEAPLPTAVNGSRRTIRDN